MRKGRRHLLQSPWVRGVAVAAVILLLPAAIRAPQLAITPGLRLPRVKPAGAPAFDDAMRKQVEDVRPDYVFVGNSMLGSRLDPELLNELLSPERSLVFAFNNSSAVHWALVLANQIVPAAHRPKAVFVFFRDRAIFRTKATLAPLRWRLSRAAEPVMDPLWRTDCQRLDGQFRDAVWRGLVWIYPLAQVPAWNLVPHLVDWLAPPFVYGELTPYQLHEALDERFALDRLGRRGAARPVPPTIWESRDLDAQIRCSFVAPMLEAARQAEVRLIMVRVQRQPVHEGHPPPQSTTLARELAVLKARLEAEGHGYLSFHGDPEVTLQMYGFADHIALEHRAAFTRHFVERMSEVIER